MFLIPWLLFVPATTLLWLQNFVSDDFWNSKRLISRLGTTRFTVRPNRLPVILHKTSVRFLWLWLETMHRAKDEQNTNQWNTCHRFDTIKWSGEKEERNTVDLQLLSAYLSVLLFFVRSYENEKRKRKMHLSVSRGSDGSSIWMVFQMVVKIKKKATRFFSKTKKKKKCQTKIESISGDWRRWNMCGIKVCLFSHKYKILHQKRASNDPEKKTQWP